VAIILTYGTACVLLAGDTEAKGRSTWRIAATRGFEWSSTFRNYIRSKSKFRALLTEEKGDARFDV
jgi:hypothetical protein